MIKLFLIRHGETDYNTESRIQGWQESALTPLGKQQAAKVAEELKSKNIDLIFSSDLLRTKQTAEAISKTLNLPIIYDWKLRERYFGTAQGQTHADLFDSPSFDRKNDYTPEQMTKYHIETLPHRNARLKSFLEGLHHLPFEARSIAVVTHGGGINAILHNLIPDYVSKGHKNCEIIEIELK